jgi:hypothetical protein
LGFAGLDVGKSRCGNQYRTPLKSEVPVCVSLSRSGQPPHGTPVRTFVVPVNDIMLLAMDVPTILTRDRSSARHEIESCLTGEPHEANRAIVAGRPTALGGTGMPRYPPDCERKTTSSHSSKRSIPD